MPIVKDYSTLTQSILDFTHRATLSPYTDYFIQQAQEEINDDIFAQNFGQGIRYMEAAYPVTPITNGTAPVPTDWLAPKAFTIFDGTGDEYGIEFKDASWIYNRYPTRTADGIPGYIGIDSGAGASDYLSYTAAAGQTVFSLTGLSGGVLLASLDGTTLVAGTDYTTTSTTLTLTTGAVAGQILFIQGDWAGFSSSDSVKFTATASQTAFSIAGLSAGPQVLFATLDGAMLVPGADYSIAGTTLTLTNGALVGQVLFVQGYPTTLTASTSSVFIFGPYPDSNYLIGGTYYQKAPLLSGTQTTNWMVLNAPSMLLANCMRQAGKFLKDVQMVEGWTQLYNDALAKLIARDTAARFGEAPLVINARSSFL